MNAGERIAPPRARREKRWFTARNAVAVLIAATGIAAWVWIRSNPDLDPFSTQGLTDLATRLGVWGPIAYALLLALSVVVSQIPGVPLAIAAGALWGPWWAGLYSVAGGFLGAMIAYYLGRTLGRDALRALTGRVVVFTKDRGEPYLGVVIFVTRLLPVLSFDVISYAAGISGLSVRIYALATLLGMTPSTLLLTFLGSRFSVSPSLALALSGVALALFLAAPWLIQRYGWFGDLVRIDRAASPDASSSSCEPPRGARDVLQGDGSG